MRSHPHEFLSQKEYASKTSVPLQSVRKSNPVRMTYHGLPSSTPFAAQENNRGTSYHPHPVRMDRSVSLVQLQLGGACSPGTCRQRVHGTAVLCAFCRSAQDCPNAPFRPDMAATSARLGVNFGQQGPNFGPTWTNLAPRWQQLGPKLRSIWCQNGGHSGPMQNPQDARFHWYFPFFAIDDALFAAMFPMLCRRWAQLGAKLSPKGVGTDLDFHVHHMASI